MNTAQALPRRTAATKGRSPKTTDPFDVSTIVSQDAERELLGQLIDLVKWPQHDAAREILDGLDVDAFTIDGGADICRAIKGAYSTAPAPTIADISNRLRVRKVSDIEAKPIDWFWPQRFSCGALTIITGMPGATKSTVVMDIASRISNGELWPDGSGRAPQGGVILFGAEDDPEKVVRPRLEAAAANLEMIRFVDGAESGQRDWLDQITLDRDLELVREQLDAFPECRAIVFDPLSQYVECQENSNSEKSRSKQLRLLQQRPPRCCR